MSPSKKPALTAEQEEMKRVMYEQLSPRRRRFIDKVGFENWDPFPEPFEPMDIRRDESGHTIESLVKQFLRTRAMAAKVGPHYARGVQELAAGIVNKDERFRGMYDFIVWYNDTLREQGKEMDWEW